MTRCCCLRCGLWRCAIGALYFNPGYPFLRSPNPLLPPPQSLGYAGWSDDWRTNAHMFSGDPAGTQHWPSCLLVRTHGPASGALSARHFTFRALPYESAEIMTGISNIPRNDVDWWVLASIKYKILTKMCQNVSKKCVKTKMCQKNVSKMLLFKISVTSGCVLHFLPNF